MPALSQGLCITTVVRMASCPRKVRSGGKERRQDARDQVKENVGRYEEAAKDNTQAGKEAIKEVKKMFKKKASEESGRKAKAKAKNDN